MKVTVLGCGSSGGVPLIGGNWGKCDPNEPRNRRRRVSILVEDDETRLLVDTSPDLREQLLDAGVSRLDAVLYTHAHADHLHGIDDLRGLNRAMRRPIPVYASETTLDEISARFAYVFRPIPESHGFYKPVLIPNRIDGPFRIGSIPVVPIDQDHGFTRSLGFRFGGIAYSTDVVELDEAAFAALAGVKIWIVDCVRTESHPTHSHLAKTLGWIARLKPERAILTHMDAGLDYAKLKRELPPGVEPGYDGLVAETL